MRTLSDSPRRLLAIIAATIFLTHALAMLLLDPAPYPHWLKWLIESSILVILLFPVLYRFSFQPLVTHVQECQRAEEQMRESEHKYRQLFENLHDAAFLIDAASGRILDANKEAERLLERPRAKIVGANESQLHAPAVAAACLERFKGMSEAGEPAQFETDVQQPTGETRAMVIGAVPLTLYGRKLVLASYRRAG